VKVRSWAIQRNGPFATRAFLSKPYFHEAFALP
jgi:hypothetical protein